MNWKDLIVDFDEDTIALVAAARSKLIDMFGHPAEQADRFVVEFFSNYKETYDEYFIHREGPIAVAAGVHYLVVLEGRLEGLRDWMSDNLTAANWAGDPLG